MIDSETERKEQLLNLLEDLEGSVKFKPSQKNLRFGFYSRIFNGIAVVEDFNNASLKLVRENGQPLGTLIANPKVVALTRKGDRLMMTLGERYKQWHLIRIQMIGTILNPENGEFHLSISKRFLFDHADTIREDA